MKIIAVTPPRFFVEEDQIITALFEEGLDLLHLKKPETSAMFSERLLTLIPSKYHRRIVTHEHFYLKEEFNLLGIHLNPRNNKEPDDYSGSLSITCSTLDELKQKKHFYDYVLLDPIFDCIIPDEFSVRFPADELKKAHKAKIIDSKVYASGGINSRNAEQLKEYGFGGVVLMTDLWNKFNPCTNSDYMDLIRHFRKLKKMIG